MHIHILGIGGTFMAGLARIAVACGHRVTGADTGLYPPMSTQLEALGIEVVEGYGEQGLSPAPDLVIIGNALSRGLPAVECVLSRRIPYTSGPAWLRSAVLEQRHVIALSGTHGKTTVSSLVTWMLEQAGRDPGFLVGGVLENFGLSARLGTSDVFVIEADEYDTAFFDKRSKFVHYCPRTLVINNLEFDHADIFPDLAAITRQFHHLIRTLPREALILRPQPDAHIDALLAQGCWSRVASFGTTPGCDWRFRYDAEAARPLTVHTPDGRELTVATPLLGLHNAWNAVAATAAVADVGVDPAVALAALASFANVKRRLECRGQADGVRVFDDFAHHPTAIAATIAALRPQAQPGRIIAVTEMRSNTMRLGVHRDTLAQSLAAADAAVVHDPGDLRWDLAAALAACPQSRVSRDIDEVVRQAVALARPGDCILVMSNGAFANIHERLLGALAAR